MARRNDTFKRITSKFSRTQAVFYRDKYGEEPVDLFLEKLLKSDPKAVAKIDDAIDEHLNGKRPDDPPPEFPASSQLRGEYRELRIRYANTRYRIIYRRSDQLFVLLHIIKKNTGKIPETEIDRAEKRFKNFKARMDADPRKKPRAAGRDAPPKTR
jgi:phage-related protein